MKMTKYRNKRFFICLSLALIILIVASFVVSSVEAQGGVSIKLSEYPEKLRFGDSVDFNWSVTQRPPSDGEYCFEIIGPDGTVSRYPKKYVIPQRGEFNGTDIWKVPSEAPIGEYHATIYFPCTDWRATSTTYFTVTRTLLVIQKFNDTNQNHKLDDVEKLRDWEFKVTDPFGEKITYETDRYGEIRIEIPEGKEGNYNITEIIDKPGWEFIEKDTDAPIVKDEDKQWIIITVEKDRQSIVRFLNIKQPIGTLLIQKFNDTNQNRKLDDEEKLPGWEFQVTDPYGKTTTHFTDVSGEKKIKVPPGKYTIEEKPKLNWTSITSTAQTATVGEGKITSKKFLNTPTGTLLINKFSDINRNSKIDEKDPKLPGWEFTVTYPNGTITPYVTNSNGEIEIKVPIGKYTIKETLKPDWEAITPPVQTEKVTKSETSLVKFLNRPPNGTLLIHKFNDSNHNGDLDTGELPMPNWGFRVKDSNGFVDITRYTNANGNITLELPANVRYNVSENLRVGWRNSKPLMQSVYITPGEVTNVTFGNYVPTPIFIQKFNDTNRNGSKDRGEEGLAGWDFRITCPGVDKIITTDEKGEAKFKDAIPGQYYRIEELMREEQRKEGWNATTPLIREDVEVQPVPVEFGNSRRVDPCIEYGIYVPPPSEDVSCWHNKNDNLNVTKCLDPCIVHCDNPNPNAGEIINVSLRVCVFPVMAPTDIVLAVDTSGSMVETGGEPLEVMRDGITEFIQKNEAIFGENVRIGLVSWDEDIDETVNLTADYDGIKKACGNFSGNLQEFTLYQVGLNGSLEVFNRCPRDEKVKKIIVFVTDAKGEYKNITRFPNPEEYTIHAITIGPPQNEEIVNMLDNLTSQYGSENVSINESSEELEKALTALTVSCIERRTLRNVTVVETLPKYMRALKDSYEIKPTSEQINSDGMEWNTVTMKWDIGDWSSDECWENTFKVLFCCRVPADVTQPKGISRVTSEVTYTDPTNNTITKHLPIPEGGIWIEPKIRKVPGFEALIAIAGLLAVAYMMWRRKR